MSSFFRELQSLFKEIKLYLWYLWKIHVFTKNHWALGWEQQGREVRKYGETDFTIIGFGVCLRSVDRNSRSLICLFNFVSLCVFSLQADGTEWAWPTTLHVLSPSETNWRPPWASSQLWPTATLTSQCGTSRESYAVHVCVNLHIKMYLLVKEKKGGMRGEV